MYLFSKGQLISKGLVSILNSSKKTNKGILPKVLWYLRSSCLRCFLGELKTQKSSFKINWPFVCKMNTYYEPNEGHVWWGLVLTIFRQNSQLYFNHGAYYAHHIDISSSKFTTFRWTWERLCESVNIKKWLFDFMY